ncbi:hypothetical protein [Virgibacillus siamensis]|uniref:hypothetical protein n=1 Tax=Virgibacillus siamensis TaxID=480071 RepID=UPI0009879226|nr:hypothetical protein [Virgibacillus siamensis]
MNWTNWQAQIPDWLDLQYVILLSGILICYIIVRIGVKWVLSKQSIKLLTYLMSSMACLVIFLFGTVLSARLDVYLLESTLHCLAVFGGFLFMLHIIQYLFRKSRNKRSV